MEVNGRRSRQAETALMACTPCDETVTAAFYCETCEENLCDDCASHHRKLGITRDHSLRELVKVKQSTSELSGTESCPGHPDNSITFYCNDHDVGLCAVCTALDHGNCEKNYLPEESKKFKESEEFGELRGLLDRMSIHAGRLKDRVRYLRDFSERIANAAVEDMQRTREQINEFLDQKMTEVLQKANDVKVQNDNKIEELNEFHKEVVNHIKHDKAQLDIYDQQHERLFVSAKRALRRHKHLKTLCAEYETTEINNYTFSPSEMLQSVLERHQNMPLGELKPVSKRLDIPGTKPELVCTYDVKATTDKETPWITGLVEVSPTKLLVTDGNNCSVKLLDVTSESIISVIYFARPPADVTRLPCHRAAIALPNDKKIQIISTLEGLLPVGDISVSGHCYGVCFHDGKLITTYLYPGKLQILGLDGVVLKTIKADSNGKDMFQKPNFVACTQTKLGSRLYVSDYGSNTVITLNMEGEIVSQFKDKYVSPRGLAALDSNSLVVCNNSRNKLVTTTRDNETETVHQWDCVAHPFAIEFSRENLQLYVSSQSRDSDEMLKIHVYSLSK